jgi:ankyrin repeat protein
MAAANGHVGKLLFSTLLDAPPFSPNLLSIHVYILKPESDRIDILTYILPLLPPSTSSTPSPLAAPNHAGSTPLHWAALNKQLAAAQALVNFDGGPGTGAALVDVKNNAGRSPLGEAENAGWDDGAVWLVSVMDLSNAGQPSEGPAEEGAEEGGEGEGEGDVKIAAKAGVDGKPVTVEITDAEGRVASMTLEDLKKDVDSR